MTFRVGQSVRITTMARIAIGRVMRINDAPYNEKAYVVRLPNWQADGVHLDVTARGYELETGHGRAEVCRCVYCPGYGKRDRRRYCEMCDAWTTATECRKCGAGTVPAAKGRTRCRVR